VKTDPLPRTAAGKKEYTASEVRKTLPLPPAESLQASARAFEAALKSEDVWAVQATGDRMIDLLASFYEVTKPPLKVLGSRPRSVKEGYYAFELFGDYTFETKVIRIWMRTAVQGKVTSYKGLLNTLIHEFCHHLDVEALGFGSTPHTRGFYERVDELYHLALATPPEKRKPLAWRKYGATWYLDWPKMRGLK
jgi:hypothetical protein